MIGAIVLAAGSATRMGRRPKCLLELDGISLIERQLTALLKAGIGEIVVVSGHYAQQIEPRLKGFPVLLIRNPNPDDGQISSLRLGLNALPVGVEAVIVALADQPLIQSQDIQDLLNAYQQRPRGRDLVAPYVDGSPGNPVIFSASVKQEMLDGDANVGGKQWRAANRDRVHQWSSSNQHYVIDVDSPDDVVRLAQNTGHQLKWP